MHPNEFALRRDDPRRHDDEAGVVDPQKLPRNRAQSQRAAPQADDDTWLNSQQARSHVGGVTNMCLWRWMRDPRVVFPLPVKMNSRNYWRLGDIRKWQAERTARSAG
jgi:predicted DNA-binding transcriptional regulator AlpA